jgi:site-specific recombinase XerC
MSAELGTVIAEFQRDAERERSRTRDALRELRRALAYFDAELGDVPVDEVAPAQVEGVLDSVRASGLPEARVEGILDALRALYAYAIERGLVRTSPVVGLVAVPSERPPAGGRTPTEAMLELGERAGALAARTIVIAFALVVVVFALALL